MHQMLLRHWSESERRYPVDAERGGEDAEARAALPGGGGILTVMVSPNDSAAGDVSDARVVFELDVEDGWPPVSGERLWAFHRGGDEYVIDNVPWFVRDLAVGDLVMAVAPDAKSHPVFQELVARSDHVTVRLFCFPAGPLGGDLARAAEPFTRLGVSAEGAPQYRMLALDIAPDDPLGEIIELLRDGQAQGAWEYEEGRITPTWIAATTEATGL